MNLLFSAISLVVCLSTLLSSANGGWVTQVGNICTVMPALSGGDDSGAILDAFHRCGHGGRIVFLDRTYHIERVMNTTGLEDVKVDLYGKLLV